MLALTIGTTGQRADLSVSGGRYVSSGFDLQTAAHLTLYCDAPARPGDPVPEGRNRHGAWFQHYLPAGDVWGSRWWLLEGAQAVPDTLRRAEEYLREAFEPWVRRGWASRIEVGEARFVTSPSGTTSLHCATRIHAPDGAFETFDAWREIAA